MKGTKTRNVLAGYVAPTLSQQQAQVRSQLFALIPWHFRTRVRESLLSDSLQANRAQIAGLIAGVNLPWAEVEAAVQEMRARKLAGFTDEEIQAELKILNQQARRESASYAY